MQTSPKRQPGGPPPGFKLPPGVTREEFRERMIERRRRMDEASPKVGDRAPDFDLPVLHGDGERVRLSELVGTPVGLIFGSYT